MFCLYAPLVVLSTIVAVSASPVCPSNTCSPCAHTPYTVTRTVTATLTPSPLPQSPSLFPLVATSTTGTGTVSVQIPPSVPAFPPQTKSSLVDTIKPSQSQDPTPAFSSSRLTSTSFALPPQVSSRPATVTATVSTPFPSPSPKINPLPPPSVSTVATTSTFTSPSFSHPPPHHNSPSAPPQSPLSTPVYSTTVPQLSSLPMPSASIVTVTVAADCPDDDNIVASDTSAVPKASNKANEKSRPSVNINSDASHDSKAIQAGDTANISAENSKVHGASGGESSISFNPLSTSKGSGVGAPLPLTPFSASTKGGLQKLCCNHKGELDSLPGTFPLVKHTEVDLSGMKGLVGIGCTAIGKSSAGLAAHKCAGSTLFCFGLSEGGVGYDCLLS